MIVKPNYSYVGPRAIFDPNYLPPKLLYRRREEESLSSMLHDSISDDFCMNILLQGIQGIGKKAIVKKVLKDLTISDRSFSKINQINVDCKEKNFEEVIIMLLVEMNKLLKLSFDFDSILNSTTSYLWNLYKLTCKKFSGSLIIIFNNIEYLKPGIFKKFLLCGKELNISIISTVNKILRTSTLEILTEFDFKKKLSFFSYNELNSILKQRACLTFPHDLNDEIIDIITDLTMEHYVPVPGKGINIFRELYPFLKDNTTIDQYEMFEICQNQFDSFQIADDFGMLSYISEEDILTTIFLDNLSNYFLNKAQFYITTKKLKELYALACESLEYKKSINEFNGLITILNNLGILTHSKKGLKGGSNKKFTNKRLDLELYFMIISPHQLKSIIDAMFGKL